MIIPLLLAVLTTVSAGWAWERFRLRYSPDFELYTQGGLGLYPSPLGRLIGAAGEPVFVTASLIAAGLVVFFVWRAAGSSWAAVAIVCSPVLLYLGHAGIDPIGLALYAAMLARVRPWLTGPAAALTHWPLLPFVLISAGGKTLHKLTLIAFLGPAAILVLLVTPYGGIVTGLGWGFFPYMAQGLGAGLLIAAPAIALYRFSPVSVMGFLLGAAEVGAQHHLQARYLLPAAVLHVCAGEQRGWPKRVIAALTTAGYLDRLRWRSLTMGASGSTHDASTLTTTQGGQYLDESHPKHNRGPRPACTIMDVQARVHPRASLWHAVGEMLALDRDGIELKPLACPTAPEKRQLLFEPSALQVKGARHLALVSNDQHSLRATAGYRGR